MYAQMLDGRALPGQRDELERAVREKLLPALREEEGFCGALQLVDRDTDETIMVVCWETEEQAVRPCRDYAASTQVAFAAIAEVSSTFRDRVSVWEVGARA
jgi:heme-degrading monooxygenase HmoA